MIADSSYVDIVSVMESQFSRRKYLPRFLIPALLFMTRFFYKIDLSKVKPLDALKSIRVPVFIIHGGLDSLIPVEQAYKLSKACLNLNSQLWVVPEAAHTYAYFIKPGEYIYKVLSFFNQAFALT